MLQFAVQSFTYTDNLNKPVGEGIGVGGAKKKKKRKRIPSQKVGRPSSVSALPRHHSNTERKTKAPPILSFRLRRIPRFCKTKRASSPHPYPRKISTPDVEASQLRRKIWTSRFFDHSWQYTKARKKKEKENEIEHHFMPWTTTQVIRLSTFWTLSALHSYRWWYTNKQQRQQKKRGRKWST